MKENFRDQEPGLKIMLKKLKKRNRFPDLINLYRNTNIKLSLSKISN